MFLLNKRMVLCDNTKPRKGKLMFDLQLVNLPDSLRLNRFTMLSIVLLSHFVSVCQAIRLDAVLVPQYKIRGQNATLLCKYELENDEELFSLKWYKFQDQQETEFYRYTPPVPSYTDQYTSSIPRYAEHKQGLYQNNNDGNQNTRRAKNYEDGRKYAQRTRDSDTNGNRRRTTYKGYGKSSKVIVDKKPVVDDGILTWKVPGIKIDTTKSVPQKVVLKKVTFRSTGVYRCEVTSRVRQIETRRGYERQRYTPDNFRMKESINRMTVVELPKSHPEIKGGVLDKVYKAGDTLNLTCVSAPSNPPATLEWKLNGEAVDQDNVVDQHLIDKKRGLFSSTIGLIMLLEERHFKDGELRVNCKGTIAAEFWKKDVENILYIENNKDRFLKVLEITESQWPNNQGFRSTELLACSTIGVILLIHVILKHILSR